jgi:hypothetical protein
MRVVMGTGYAGPGWVWPKADMVLDIKSRATVVSQPSGSNAKNGKCIALWIGNRTPISNAPLWGVESKPRPLGGVVYFSGHDEKSNINLGNPIDSLQAVLKP